MSEGSKKDTCYQITVGNLLTKFFHITYINIKPYQLPLCRSKAGVYKFSKNLHVSRLVPRWRFTNVRQAPPYKI